VAEQRASRATVVARRVRHDRLSQDEGVGLRCKGAGTDGRENLPAESLVLMSDQATPRQAVAGTSLILSILLAVASATVVLVVVRRLLSGGRRP
jgi:hypothetical protein